MMVHSILNVQQGQLCKKLLHKVKNELCGGHDGLALNTCYSTVTYKVFIELTNFIESAPKQSRPVLRK